MIHRRYYNVWASHLNIGSNSLQTLKADSKALSVLPIRLKHSVLCLVYLETPTVVIADFFSVNYLYGVSAVYTLQNLAVYCYVCSSELFTLKHKYFT